MKTLFMMLFVLVMAGVAMAAEVAAPVATPPSTFAAFMARMQNNQVVVGMLVAAILDFIFAINPEWKSNGALHFLYTVAKGKSTPPAA